MIRTHWNRRVLLTGALLGCASESRGAVLFERNVDASADASDSAAQRADACASCSSIELTDEGATALVGGDGGSERLDLCPPGELLIGYTGALRDVSATSDSVNAITYLDGRCGVPSLGSDGVLRVTPAGTLSARGEALGSVAAWSQLCASDEVVVGALGRSGQAVDRLALLCGSFRVDASGALTMDTERELASAGGTGGTPFALRCPPGQLARGHHLRAGRWLDAFSLVCGSARASPENVSAP